MRFKKVLILVVVSLIMSGCSKEKEVLVTVPIFPDSYSVEHFNSAKNKREEVSFKVDIEFPSSKLIDFYENHFESIGYQKYNDDGLANQTWENIDHKTGEWVVVNEPPARLIYSWVNNAENKRAVLGLKYKYDGENNNWNKVLLVNCFVQNFQ